MARIQINQPTQEEVFNIQTSKTGTKHAIATFGPDYGHHEIHSGKMFSYCEEASLGAGGDLTIVFISPPANQDPAHLLISVSATKEFTIELFEDPTGSEGAVATVFNRNRLSLNTPNAAVYAGGSIGSGVPIDCDIAGSGNKTGGASRSFNEWVLGNGKKYRIRVESNVASNIVALKLMWYESGDAF